MSETTPSSGELSLSQQSLSIIGIVGFILLFLLILWIAYIPMRPDTSVDAARTQQRVETYERLNNAGIEKATSYGVVDAEKGVFRIPVDRAMELTVQELLQTGEE